MASAVVLLPSVDFPTSIQWRNARSSRSCGTAFQPQGIVFLSAVECYRTTCKSFVLWDIRLVLYLLSVAHFRSSGVLLAVAARLPQHLVQLYRVARSVAFLRFQSYVLSLWRSVA